MEQKVAPKRRTKSAEQALQALMRQCARSERSSGDALRLMRQWGVADEDARKVLAKLRADRFIDDARYAEAYTRDKLNLSGWGARKIKMGLRAKGVAQDIIEDVVSPMFADSDMESRLEQVLRNKFRTLRYKDSYDAKVKLTRFGVSRGFDIEMVLDCAAKIVND